MRKIIIRILIAIGIILGFHRICCLSALESIEDYIRYRKLSPDEIRFMINKDDLTLIDEVRARVRTDEGVLVLDIERHFISYYVYPVKLYKFKKGYFKTTRSYELKDVDPKWLEERNIRWVMGPDAAGVLRLKNIKEIAS